MFPKNKILFFSVTAFLLAHFSIASFAQVNRDLLAKKWIYSGTEEFGVVRAPDSTAKADFLELKTDGNFIMAKEGKQWNGSWLLNEKTSVITLTDTKSKKKFNYTIKDVGNKQLVLEYQSPDLVRTKYHYQSKE